MANASHNGGSYEQDGTFDWRCASCGEEGSRSYVGLATSTENPRTADFDGLVVLVEVDHAFAGCNGSVEYTGGYRSWPPRRTDVRRRVG